MGYRPGVYHLVSCEHPNSGGEVLKSSRAVEINVGIMCGCFPALPPILRSVRLGSAYIHFSDSRIFKWLHLAGDTSETKSVPSGKMRLTLGSQIKGKGHFFTMRNLFSSRGTNDTTSISLSLEDSRPSGQGFLMRQSQTDIETGLVAGGVACARERMET